MLSYYSIAVALLAAGATNLAASPPRAMKETPSVTVQNNRRHPVAVYLELGATASAQVPDQEVRLGTVAGSATTSFTLPAWIVFNRDAAQILVRPAAGLARASHWITLSPGEHVEVVVPRS